MARDLEQITRDYWGVSCEVKIPGVGSMDVGEALKILQSANYLRPSDTRLASVVYELLQDIIQGNEEWREEHQGAGLLLTLPMKT
jgi:hypothetical protein